MSPVFRHGRLRLYLLKLLDESPRHGYEVIRLLQDRFMGVYAPSPGTIYPRLARLEQEGLVTHDESDGRKVYRITEKGRAELHSRASDLSELEEEITASVRDIAREVSEDVRATVRNLREELTWAARDVHRRGSAGPGASPHGEGASPHGEAARDRADTWREAAESAEARRERAEARRPRASAWQEAAQEPADAWREAAAEHVAGAARDQARQAREEARRAREEGRRAREEARQDRPGHGRGQPGPGAQDEPGRGRSGWDRQSWADWTGRRSWPPGSAGWANPRAFRDLEQLARHFSRELRSAAWQAQAVSEDAVSDLRTILDDALDRIKAEVFGDKPGPGPAPGPAGTGDAGQDDPAGTTPHAAEASEHPADN